MAGDLHWRMPSRAIRWVSIVLDFAFAVVEFLEAGVEGGGFARAGGAGEEDESAGGFEGGGEGLLLMAGEAEATEGVEFAGAVEEAEGHVFAVGGGDEREADVEDGGGILVGIDPAAVLGAASFRDVEGGAGFDEGDEPAALFGASTAMGAHDAEVAGLHEDVLFVGADEEIAAPKAMA